MSQQTINSKWNDNRKTDAFKSTRKMYQNKKSFSNTMPTNTRVWRDKSTTRSNNSRAFENKNKNNMRNFSGKQWKRDPPKQINNTISEQPIFKSKWTAKRPEKDNSDNIFQKKNILKSRNDKIAPVPEKKSFNKKIVIIKRKTRKQMEAEKKAIYDSFIKESFILKVADHLGNKKIINETSCSDSWDVGNEKCIDATEEYLDEFDKWERELLEYVDGSDDHEISKKKRKDFFTGSYKSIYDYYKLPDYDNKNNKNDKNITENNKQLKIKYMNEHKSMLKKSLMGLSVLPAIMVEDTLENIEEAYDSLYEFMISKRMKIIDISFEYDINNLLEINDKELRKEFNKLRKKYNSIKKIQKKLENKEKIQKNEQDKYNSRHECIFLYHRLRYYDKYYMDGKLNFTNNIK